ncbi:MAG: ATP-binding protein [Lachnospiraceae bacterium]|nr:ATP-binding protein [Lachnospiraceae bacterium]
METQNKKVDASPTKDFFIYMLTRDIDVKPAIVELIDNSIDGAKRTRPNKNYNDLFIRIEMSSDKFIIEDNCGGIDIETARTYAFKFGRPSSRKEGTAAFFTGIFGIGMKRTLFKLGNKFEIISTTNTEHFVLKVDVNKWLKDDEWNFQFEKAETGLKNTETGTKIIVEDLNDDITAKFESELFINSLIDYIQKYRTVEAENGLRIEVNGITIDYGKEKLLESKNIQPYNFKIKDSQGTITIIAGITEKGEPNKAGWYIYCNGRLVLYADKTSLTGWGNNTRIYHNSLAEFRGYVYFESKDLLALPWNTTKTGVDTSNRLYIIATQKMHEAMVQIFKLIDELKRKYDVNDLKDLDFICKAKKEELTYSRIAKINQNVDFNIIEPEQKISMTKITFSKPTVEVDKVKDNMGEKTNKVVGEKLFEYYCEMEEI